MKYSISFAACLLLFGAAHAQNSKKAPADDAATTQKNLVAAGKTALSGAFTTDRNRPIRGVEVFIYEKDSSISASGYTDSMGHYETNAVLPGVHSIKIVYPGSKRMFIPNVTMKSGLTQLSVRANAPEADTTADAAAFFPKESAKKLSKPAPVVH